MTQPKEPQSPEDVAGVGAEEAQTDEALPLPLEENDANAQPG